MRRMIFCVPIQEIRKNPVTNVPMMAPRVESGIYFADYVSGAVKVLEGQPLRPPEKWFRGRSRE